MTSNELHQITESARALYANIKADIQNAGTRIEHIRITTLAQEAHQLLTDLENLTAGSASEESSPA